MDATTVVIAELRIAVPIWEMAAKLLHPRISCKKEEKKMVRHKLTTASLSGGWVPGTP